MDLWVVAAAAGAGYLAKYFHRLSKSIDRSPHLSSEDSNGESPSSPFHGQVRRDRLGKDISLDRRASDVNSPNGLLTVDLASNGGVDGEKVRHLRNYNEDNVLSESNSPGTFTANENYNDIEDGNERSSSIGCNCSFLLHDSSAREVGSVRNHSGNKTSFRSRHMCGHISRPLNSLESCLVAQLYNEHAKIEDHAFSSCSSPARASRSLLVCDRSQIISRENDDDSCCALIGREEYKLHREASQLKDEKLLFGVPSLPKIGSSNDVKKMRFNADNQRSERLSSSNGELTGKHIYTQHDATFLFSLGISFGIITAILANKTEMEKLRELLKQNENLVQDLHEELDMKDSMTVKELHGENYGSQDTCDHSFRDKDLHEFSPEKHMDNSPIIDCKKSYDQKEEENSESMSKIEAELEAELERLGLNMNESSLDRRLSELVELDADFVADFAQGELRADMMSGEDFVHPKSNEDASDPMTVPVDYAVSPHELSLRLHEVIQSRLEERVQELELALQNSQIKLRFMESKHAGCSPKYVPSCGQESSFAEGNILTYDDCDPIAEPAVMNSSGEALGAYNEAYEESIKIDDTEEHSPLSTHDTDDKGGSRSHNWHVLGNQRGGSNGPITYSAFNGERLSRELPFSEATMLEVQSSSFHGLNDVNGDEECDCDSEMERQLIRQIVERTKKGSPVFQNARRILYSMDDDHH